MAEVCVQEVDGLIENTANPVAQEYRDVLGLTRNVLKHERRMADLCGHEPSHRCQRIFEEKPVQKIRVHARVVPVVIVEIEAGYHKRLWCIRYGEIPVCSGDCLGDEAHRGDDERPLRVVKRAGGVDLERVLDGHGFPPVMQMVSDHK